MYIENGIAYAGEKTPMLKICGVRPMNDHILWIRFTNGESKTFDFKHLLETPAFAPLKDENIFKSVYIDYGVPVWNDGDIDIAPVYLYKHGVVDC